jgi:hypothetical protein
MIDRVRDWFAPSRPRSVAPPAIRADFMRGNRGVVFGGWRPALREASDDVGASWDLAAARTIDLIQNSGWMAGAIDQAVANTVGTGLRLKAMPENDLFGMSNRQAESWAQAVEQRWSLWAEKPYECDMGGDGRSASCRPQSGALGSRLARSGRKCHGGNARVGAMAQRYGSRRRIASCCKELKTMKASRFKDARWSEDCRRSSGLRPRERL